MRDDDGDQLVLSGEVPANGTLTIVDEDNDIPVSNRGDTVELVNPLGQGSDVVEYEREDVETGEFIEFDD